MNFLPKSTNFKGFTLTRTYFTSRYGKLYRSLAKPCQGFTLIELLVSITIISVLAVIAFAAFSGLTGRGNDSKRAGDVKAIADALEVKKGTSATYQQIAETDFAGGVAPSDPDGTRTEKYCYKDGTSPILNPSAWSGTVCPDATWTSINGTLPTVTSGAKYFKVCALNGAGTAVICYGSRQ